jgi:NAD(P)-dependent dehydrogenase (short-subunit alcohol dehydrogenase family)
MAAGMGVSRLDAVCAPGRTAVITGAASGIGRETALVLAGRGMNVVLADVNETAVQQVAQELIRQHGAERVLAVAVDVGLVGAMASLADRVAGHLGDVSLLMNNAVTRAGGGVFEPLEGWQQAVQVNLWGVIHGVRAFLPRMLDSPAPAMVVNCGSKQGITNPPGNSAYNMTKAALKSYTESLAHALRDRADAAVTAHLLIPGWTTTGEREHEPGAWLPGQVVERMLQGLQRGDFYILCPDNEVTLETDARRIEWAAGDIIHNRPALSRWDPDHAAQFEAFKRG